MWVGILNSNLKCPFFYVISICKNWIYAVIIIVLKFFFCVTILGHVINRVVNDKQKQVPSSVSEGFMAR